jgi:hypothetical protein
MLAMRISTGAMIVSAHHWMGGATSLGANHEAWISLVTNEGCFFFGAHILKDIYASPA